MPLLLPTLGVGAELAIGGAAAMAIPIAIHLLTRWRRHVHPWGAMRFILEAYRRHSRRLRLEQILLLLVRCLIPLLLGLALWDPPLPGFGGALGGLGATDRLICIVLDDTLSSRAHGDATPGSPRRFEALRDSALWVVDHLSRGDRVAVWRSARPGRAVLVPATFDRQHVRRAIEQIEPRFARSDLQQTLTLVDSFLKESAPDVSADRAFVVVLSDFSRAVLEKSGDDDGGISGGVVAALAERAQLVVPRPMPAVANVAIRRLRPTRPTLLMLRGQAATVPVEVTLWRPVIGSSAEALTSLDLSVIGPDPAALLGVLRREHRWSAGQTEATIRVDVPINSANPIADAHLLVRARIDADALAEDDQRLAVVQVRERLRVAVVDNTSATYWATVGVVGLTPARWITLALSPIQEQENNAPIRVAPLAAATLDASALATVDAAIVTRPDLLGAVGWEALGSLARRGGVVWIVTPDQAAAGWGAQLRQAFNLDWELGIEPIVPAQPASVLDVASGAVPGELPAWSIMTDTPTPEPLAVLSADWKSLLSSVRVYRRLPLTLRDQSDDAWLKITPIAGEAADGNALLTCTSVGAGRVLLLAAAIDPAWTNLPTKPLFVPLLHESLRGLLGESGSAARVAGIVTGDQPVLSHDWNDAQALVRRDLRGTGEASEGDALLLRRTDAGLTPIDPLAEPGVYDSSPLHTQTLAVNTDPAASDTAALDENQIADWLAAAARWQWLGAPKPGATPAFLVARAATLNVGYSLLWATLALVGFEMLLARWFSHARAGGKSSVVTRLAHLVRGAGA